MILFTDAAAAAAAAGWPHFEMFALLALVAAQQPSCESPSWHTVFDLDPSVECPGDWVQTLPSPGVLHEPPVPVCSRGKSATLAQVSAILAEGWTYSEIRGELVGHVMGGIDAFRYESWRGENTIDDAYVDGIAIARWGARERIHVATYGVGLSYPARGYSYYPVGNCPCHGGGELPPDWLGENYFCDSGNRGGSQCQVGPYEPLTGGARSDVELAASNCSSASFAVGTWYNGLAAPMFNESVGSAGFLCRGSRFATDDDFVGVPFGSFVHTVAGGAFVNDPIEGRIMGGQPAGTPDELSWGNEDTGLSALRLKVFGCRTSTSRCGNGVVEGAEQCDFGFDSLTNTSNNGPGKGAWTFVACDPASPCAHHEARIACAPPTLRMFRCALRMLVRLHGLESACLQGHGLVLHPVSARAIWPGIPGKGGGRLEGAAGMGEDCGCGFPRNVQRGTQQLQHRLVCPLRAGHRDQQLPGHAEEVPPLDQPPLSVRCADDDGLPATGLPQLFRLPAA